MVFAARALTAVCIMLVPPAMKEYAAGGYADNSELVFIGLVQF